MQEEDFFKDKMISGELRFIARDGTVRWVELTAVKIDREGCPAILNYVSNVSGMSTAEQEKEEMLRVIENR